MRIELEEIQEACMGPIYKEKRTLIQGEREAGKFRIKGVQIVELRNREVHNKRNIHSFNYSVYDTQHYV